MFDILIYLYETYIYSEIDIISDYEFLINDLSEIGFQKKDIYNALRWLRTLSSYEKNIFLPINICSNYMPTRVYTKEELLRFNVDCRGFMLFLEHLEIVTLDTREIIIERIMDLDIKELNIEDLKWIVLIILFNMPKCKIFYKKLEKLLFNCKEDFVH